MPLRDSCIAAVVATLCLCGTYALASSCSNVNPTTPAEADEIVEGESATVMMQYRELIAAYDQANDRVEAALDGDNPVELHNAIEAKQLAEQDLAAHASP